MSPETTLRTLQLVTTPRPFFDNQIRSLERRGVASTVVAVPGARPRSPLDYARYQGAVLRNSAGSDYDIVQANYGLTGPAAIAQPNRPVVLWLWGGELSGKFRHVVRGCAALADAVVVMSKDMAAKLDHPCYVIQHGVDTDRFRPKSPTDARADLGWEDDSKHVLFPYDPARPIKNYPRAEEVVERAAAELDVDVNLQVVHGVPHERFPVYMNAADALLLTSTSEGSPNTVKEALACNLPVVSVDVGDVDEMLTGVRCCHVCDSDEELVHRLADVLESGERSDGRERASEYRLEKRTDDILSVYEEILGKTVR